MSMYVKIIIIGMLLFLLLSLCGFVAFMLKVISGEDFKKQLMINSVACISASFVASLFYFIINIITNYN